MSGSFQDEEDGGDEEVAASPMTLPSTPTPVRYPGLILQLHISGPKITPELLASETKSIYEDLLPLETKLVNLPTTTDTNFLERDFNALKSLHRDLLLRHIDFFMATNPVWTKQIKQIWKGSKQLIVSVPARRRKDLVPKSGIRRSGLKMMVKGESLDAFGDTGSMHNIIDEAYAFKNGLEIQDQPIHMQLGDKSTLLSHGTVEIPVDFIENPEKLLHITARVVRNFSFDLLLGKHFLKRTNTLTSYIHRFTTCAFPRLTSSNFFNFIGHSSERFHVSLGNGVEVDTLLDTGASCNVVDLGWARQRGLRIYTDKHSRGSILLPSGERKPTVGQVRTTITLPGGWTIPINLEVLEDCVAPVVLGDEVIFNHRLYDERYTDAFVSSKMYDVNNGLLYMGYEPWYIRIVQKAKERYRNHDMLQGTSTASVNDADEMERQWEWDLENRHGADADNDEWMREYLRRQEHEKALYPNVTFQDKVLIRYVPPELVRVLGESPYSS